MKPNIRLSEYKAVLKGAVLEFTSNELEDNSITLQRSQNIVQFLYENIDKPATNEDLFVLIETTKEQFPELIEPIEDAIETFELHKKYLIS